MCNHEWNIDPLDMTKRIPNNNFASMRKINSGSGLYEWIDEKYYYWKHGECIKRHSTNIHCLKCNIYLIDPICYFCRKQNNFEIMFSCECKNRECYDHWHCFECHEKRFKKQLDDNTFFDYFDCHGEQYKKQSENDTFSRDILFTIF